MRTVESGMGRVGGRGAAERTQRKLVGGGVGWACWPGPGSKWHGRHLSREGLFRVLRGKIDGKIDGKIKSHDKEEHEETKDMKVRRRHWLTVDVRRIDRSTAERKEKSSAQRSMRRAFHSRVASRH